MLHQVKEHKKPKGNPVQSREQTVWYCVERRWTQNTQNIPLKRKQSSACPNNINKLFAVYVYASMYTSVCLLCQTSASVYLFLPFSYRVSFRCMKSFTCSSCQSIEKPVTEFPEQCRYDQALNYTALLGRYLHIKQMKHSCGNRHLCVLKLDVTSGYGSHCQTTHQSAFDSSVSSPRPTCPVNFPQTCNHSYRPPGGYQKHCKLKG